MNISVKIFRLALLVMSGLFLISGTAAAKSPVILDTDIGDDIDDTWALALLLRSPELDLKLVTTANGKAEYRAKIVARMLTVAKRTDVSIGLGTGGREGSGGQQAWVKDHKLSDYPGKVHADGAAAMIEAIEKSPEPVTLIAIGPLGTVAEALKRRPSIAAKCDFAAMQGSVRVGYDGDRKNIVAEYNVAQNVSAAKSVFAAHWRHAAITPLDTCGTVQLSGKRFQQLKESRDPLVQTVLENYRVWSGTPNLAKLDRSSTLYDTVAVYLALPGGSPLMKLETLPIRVDDNGYTRIDAKTGATMAVATEWKDREGYNELLVRRLLGK